MTKRLTRLWRIQIHQDLTTAWRFYQVMRIIRKKYPDMNLFDRIDKATMSFNLSTAEARLTYTLKHGSVHDAPKQKENA